MVETREKEKDELKILFYSSLTMGCCCSKQSSAAFGGDGQRLGTADEERGKRAAAAAEKRFTDQPIYTDANLTDEERAKIRAERLAAVEARMTKQEKQAMKQKKKPTNDEPLRGPNSQNTMRWTAG
jgi:hypothetical protein